MARSSFYDPFTARAISEDTFLARAQRYEVELSRARDAVDVAVARLDAARSQYQQRYWDRELHQRVAAMDAYDVAVMDMSEQFFAAYPSATDEVEEDALGALFFDDPGGELQGYMEGYDWPREYDDWPDDLADEWEFGFDYESEEAS